jgi:hypothetical protein
MRTPHFLLLLVPLLAATLSAAPQRADQPADAADRFLGVWSGSWEHEGGGSGGIELTLEHEKGKPMTGKVSVTGEPTYKATLASVSFDGAKMTAKYGFTPDPDGEVVLTATFEGDALTGTWLLREKGSDSAVANGGWKAKRGEKQ